MVSAGADKELKFWRLDTTSKRALRSDGSKEEKYTWSLAVSSTEHNREILCTDWSRCKNTFGYLTASACEERTILLHYMENNRRNDGIYGACLAATKLEAHRGSIRDLKWHHKDPNKLASVSSDGLVKIWAVTQ